MDDASPSPAPWRRPLNEPPPRPPTPADAVAAAYVGYLAGWFDLARLATAQRLHRAGVRGPLLNDN